MRKRVQIALAVLLVAVLTVLGWQVLREREPVYEGRPLSVWIKEGYFGRVEGPTPQKANEAVLRVGNKALPYYVRLLRTRADSSLKVKVTQWLEKIPYLNFHYAGSDTGMRRALGACGLGMLGPAAKPALPALTKLLAHGDEEQMTHAALTLTVIGLDGIQPLTNLLQNSKAKYRFRVVTALGTYAKPYNLAPVWIRYAPDAMPLADAKPYRLWPSTLRSSQTPQETEAAANLVVPILISCLSDSDIKVQGAAMASLGKFGRQPEAILPVVVDRLQNATNDTVLRVLALAALADFGPKATNAVPEVLRCLKDRDFMVRHAAPEVLKKIDPEAAAKAGVK